MNEMNRANNPLSLLLFILLLALSQRSMTYILLGKVIIPEFLSLLHHYTTTTTYYEMDLAELYIPTHYNELKKRWKYAVSSLNDITIYLSMNDYGKALDLVDQTLVNLQRIAMIPQNTKAIATVRSFPEVCYCYYF